MVNDRSRLPASLAVHFPVAVMVVAVPATTVLLDRVNWSMVLADAGPTNSRGDARTATRVAAPSLSARMDISLVWSARSLGIDPYSTEP